MSSNPIKRLFAKQTMTQSEREETRSIPTKAVKAELLREPHQIEASHGAYDFTVQSFDEYHLHDELVYTKDIDENASAGNKIDKVFDEISPTVFTTKSRAKQLQPVTKLTMSDQTASYSSHSDDCNSNDKNARTGQRVVFSTNQTLESSNALTKFPWLGATTSAKNIFDSISNDGNNFSGENRYMERLHLTSYKSDSTSDNANSNCVNNFAGKNRQQKYPTSGKSNLTSDNSYSNGENNFLGKSRYIDRLHPTSYNSDSSSDDSSNENRNKERLHPLAEFPWSSPTTTCNSDNPNSNDENNFAGRNRQRYPASCTGDSTSDDSNSNSENNFLGNSRYVDRQHPKSYNSDSNGDELASNDSRYNVLERCAVSNQTNAAQRKCEDEHVNNGTSDDGGQKARNRKKLTAVQAQHDYSFLHIWNIGTNKNFVYCKICVQNPTVVRLYANNSIPKFARVEGTQFRGEIIREHMTKKYHIESVKAWKNKVKEGNDDGATNLVRMISKVNEQVANKIGGYACTIYNDAKRLTMSAFSWPSRQISYEVGHAFNINDPKQNATDVLKLNLQYLNPKCHAEILECIVAVEDKFIEEKINDCFALSIRVDGSVDRTNIDKIYILAKLVNGAGDLETIFMGVGQQTQRKAEGLHLAVKNTIESIGAGLYEKCIKKMSSFVTDGAEINKGDKSGLWKRIDDDAAAFGALQTILKIWCAAHRSDLIMKDLSKNIAELSTLLSMLSSIASHFNRSPMRFSDLKNVSEEHNLKLMSLPTIYDVRWCENKEKLIDSLLNSWKCLVLYFVEVEAENGKCYSNFLTNYKHLVMTAFIADLLLIFKILQKKLQSDELNPVSLREHIDTFSKSIEDMKVGQLIGGWEERLSSEIISETTTSECGEYTEHKTWHGIELDISEIEKRGATRRVRDFNAIKLQILNQVTKLTAERFANDEKLVDVLSPFVKLDPSADIRRVHELIASDLELVHLNMQFKELCRSADVKTFNMMQLISHLAKSGGFETVLKALARVAAATPHSADVERSISANNLLKTSLRSSIDLKTENLYLFIHFNLPPLTEWNPRKAVIHWINKKNRRSHNMAIEERRRKTTQQRHFNGVFAQDQKDNMLFGDIEIGIENTDDDHEMYEPELNVAKRRKHN